jgi:sugar-phosphatase
MIKAVIFDMDGILIDSEPFWQEAEIRVFGRLGLRLTSEMCMQTMGIRVDEVVQYWYDKSPWHGETVGSVASEIMDNLEQLILSKGQAMDGVYHMLDFCEKNDLRTALASSSYIRLIQAVLKKLDLAKRFEVVHSGEFEAYGKPHPGIFLTALQKLNLNYNEVFVIEDSFPGLISAKAARLQVVCVPEKTIRQQTKYDIAEIKLDTLADFNESHLAILNENSNHKVL